MTTDLDVEAILAVEGIRSVPVPRAQVALEQLSDTLRDALANVSGYDLARATPAQRREIVDFRAWLLDTMDPIKTWLDRIDHMWRLAGEKTGARQFPVGDGESVRLEDPPSTYVVQEQQLRTRLLELERDGLVTREEIDEAVTTVISYKSDNRRLNALARNRGDAVAEAIEEFRTKVEAQPGRERVSYPGRRAK